jgi:hypothetical protein
MTSVRTSTALAGLGATAAWLTFVSAAAPARAVVLAALVLLPGNAFTRRFRFPAGWRRRVLVVSAGLVVALTVELLDRLVGHEPASTVAAFVLLASSLGLLRAARHVARRVPVRAVEPTPDVPVTTSVVPVPAVAPVPAVVPAPLPVVPAVHRAS